MQQQAFEHIERKQNIKRLPNCFFKREKRITIESTTCHTISGPKLFEQGQNFEPGLLLPWFVLCDKSNDWEVKYAIEDSTLMFFPSYPCFCCLMFTQGLHSQNSSSKGHRFSRERKFQNSNHWKNQKFSNLGVVVLSITTYYIKMGKVWEITVSSNLNWYSSKKKNLNWKLSIE